MEVLEHLDDGELLLSTSSVIWFYEDRLINMNVRSIITFTIDGVPGFLHRVSVEDYIGKE